MTNSLIYRDDRIVRPGYRAGYRYHTGIHYWADYYILEILNPETLEPVPEGEWERMVVTTAKGGCPPYQIQDKRPYPYYARRVPVRQLDVRHDRILGRSDDMFIFRAVNIYQEPYRPDTFTHKRGWKRIPGYPLQKGQGRKRPYEDKG